MSEKDLAEYRKIVGDIDYGEYMGAEQQGEMLKRCSILDNIEIVYSSNTQMLEQYTIN